MIKQLVMTAVIACASFATIAEERASNVAGVSYELTSAIDIAHAALGKEATAAAASATTERSWFQKLSETGSGEVEFNARFVGGYLLEKYGPSVASVAERLGERSSERLMKGLRVEARVRF